MSRILTNPKQDLRALRGLVNKTLRGWQVNLDLAVQGLDMPVLEMPMGYRQMIASQRQAFPEQPQLSIVSRELYHGIYSAREITGEIFRVHNPGALPAHVSKDRDAMIPDDWHHNDEELGWNAMRARWNEILISPDHSPHPGRIEEDRALIHGLHRSARLALAADRATQAVAYDALQIARGGENSYRSRFEEDSAIMRMAIEKVNASIGQLLATRTHYDQRERMHHHHHVATALSRHFSSAPHVRRQLARATAGRSF